MSHEGGASTRVSVGRGDWPAAPARHPGRLRPARLSRLALTLAAPPWRQPPCAACARPDQPPAARPHDLGRRRRRRPAPGARRWPRSCAAQRPDRLLYLGDVYETGPRASSERGYDAALRAARAADDPDARQPRVGQPRDGLRPLLAREASAGRCPAGTAVTRPRGWEVLSLNSESAARPGLPAAPLAARRAARPGTCRIAIWHRPRWSSGWHGDQADMAPLWNALRGHARIVLSGHDHDLQRFADRDGLRQIVSGGGGRPQHPASRTRLARDAALRRPDDAGGARLRLTGRTIERRAAACWTAAS